MSFEGGMDHIDDKGAWRSKRDRRIPSIKSGAQIQQESPAQITPDLTPNFVKVRDIRTARALSEEAVDLSHLTSKQITSILVRGLRFASEIKPSEKAKELLLVQEAYLDPIPTPKFINFDPSQFISIVKTNPNRSQRETALLTR